MYKDSVLVDIDRDGGIGSKRAGEFGGNVYEETNEEEMIEGVEGFRQFQLCLIRNTTMRKDMLDPAL